MALTPFLYLGNQSSILNIYEYVGTEARPEKLTKIQATRVGMTNNSWMLFSAKFVVVILKFNLPLKLSGSGLTSCISEVLRFKNVCNCFKHNNFMIIIIHDTLINKRQSYSHKLWQSLFHNLVIRLFLNSFVLTIVIVNINV